MKKEKIIISAHLVDFVKSLDGKIVFRNENQNLVSFMLSRDEWEKLFYETIISGNNPYELYSWSQNFNSQHFK